MGLNKWKESARQVYRDQQLQDNEGGCGEPVGFVTGFIEACKQRQSEIEKLEKELQNTREILKKNPSDFMLKCGECGNVVVWYEQCTYIEEIASLKKELQATREQLEEAEKVIDFYATFSHWLGLTDKVPFDVLKWIRIVEDDMDENNIGGLIARQYFKQKNEVKQ